MISRKAVIIALIGSLILGYVGLRFGILIDAMPDLPSGIENAIANIFPDVLLPFTPPATLGMAAILCASAGFAGVWMGYAYSLSTKADRPGEEAGSARWMNKKEISIFRDSKDKYNNVLLTRDTALRISWAGGGYKLADRIEYERNLNVLVIGGSGAGKTRYYVKPNLLQTHGNYVVTDPKGSLLPETAGYMASKGYTVKSYNTIDFSASNKYNPFSYIKTEADILIFAEALIANTTSEDAQSGEQFWQDAERLLYISLIAYLKYWCPADFNFSGLLMLLAQAEAKEEDESYMSPLDYLFNEIETGTKRVRIRPTVTAPADGKVEFPYRSVPQHFDWVPSNLWRATDGRRPGDIRPDGQRGLTVKDDFALDNYKAFKVAAGKTLKSIIISCNVRMKPFGVGELRALLDQTEDDMELDKLGDPDRKLIVYCIMSDTQPTFKAIHAIMQWQAINILCDKALFEYGGRLPRFVHFVLDEFANTGKFPNMERVIAVTRSRNIGISIILQSSAQLKANYDEAKASVIMDNCNTWLYLGGAGNETNEVISKALGKETIRQITYSTSKGQSASSTKNFNTTGRDLMDPAEVGKMSKRQAIVLITGAQGFKGDKYRLEDHPHWQAMEKAEGFDFHRYLAGLYEDVPQDGVIEGVLR
jgi:type IV secretion system protein VirD4